jgi:arginyl-tRNA synthetase
VLANVLTATGYRVEKEYYVNDAGRQMDILAVSVLLRYLQAGGAVIALPENAYQGDYIVALAEDLRRRDGDAYTCEAGGLAVVADGDAETALDGLIANSKAILGGTRYASLHRFARDEILPGIKTDLAHFGVTFDNWFSESSLSEDDQIANSLAALTASGTIYSEGGARWFRSTAYGDEKDRVVVRDNGNATYFASDIAYHANKYRRGYDHLINIWGADHHGYISRVKAAIAALGHEPEQLEVLLVQFAALYRHGEKVAMSTRSGQFVTLAELVDEVGSDAARFFYITRRSDQHLDFDLDLAKSASNDNPVYSVQYAHARIKSILNQVVDKGFSTDMTAGRAALHRLDDDKEKSLAGQLLRYPGVIDTAAVNREPHLITNYLRELAADFHAYYNGCRIITDDGEQRNARLALVVAIKQVIANGLELLGVSAPEAM